MKVVCLLNAQAGTLRARNPGDFRDLVLAAFARRGVAAEVEIVSAGELRAKVERAAAMGRQGDIAALVVGGGDGTVSCAAAVLAGTDMPLAILPTGTLNHFARDLGIPLELDAAVAVIAQAHARQVDVAEVNGRIFVNNSSVGVYPYMVLDRERRMRREGRRKWSAMARAALRMLWYFPQRRLTIRAAGWAAPYRTPCVFIGNNEYSLALASLGRRAALNQGELWLYISKQGSAAALLLFAGRWALGLFDASRDLRILRVGSAEIISRSSRLFVALDGEVESMRSPLRYRSRPGALRVLAPERPGG
jgi:diacylglycerol kinase family enzyme